MTGLRDPGLYLNRDLSLLEYNARLLELARDPRRPLLERLRLHVVLATNLDELFEIRVAGLRQRAARGMPADGPDGIPPARALAQLSARAHELVEAQYQLVAFSLMPELEHNHIRVRRHTVWNEAEREWAQRFFAAELAPLLTPVRLDPAHPFPRIHNRRLSFVVTLRGQDAYGQEHEQAIATVQMPRSAPSVVQLPRAVAGAPHDFVLLSSFIAAFGEAELFGGMEVTGCYPFRITRNSDLQLDEVGPEELRAAVEEELLHRDTGDAVRLELVSDCPEELAELLLRKVGLEAGDLYRLNGPIDLRRLEAVYQGCDRPDLKFPSHLATTPAGLRRGADVFAALDAGDQLLHHPFQATQPVTDLLRQAATDPDVTAIRQTLYRASSDSPMVDALIEAALLGKDVTVVVELRARWSEDQNLHAAARLSKHGVRVVHGAVKAHAKLLLITRRHGAASGDSLRRYAHLGTGNYHPDPLQPYTDLSTLTRDDEVGVDLEALFDELAGDGPPRPRRLVWTAPKDLLGRLLSLFDRAAAAARSGAPARIALKTNALTEPDIIEALYRASCAGVEVDVVVRGMCALRPGVPGVSERIRVRSVLGRFHEHSRLIHVRAGDEVTTLGTSADLAPRNLRRRVEVAWPLPPALGERAVEELITSYLADAAAAWALGPDGRWSRIEDGVGPAAQERLHGQSGARSA